MRRELAAVRGGRVADGVARDHALRPRSKGESSALNGTKGICSVFLPTKGVARLRPEGRSELRSARSRARLPRDSLTKFLTDRQRTRHSLFAGEATRPGFPALADDPAQLELVLLQPPPHAEQH